MLRFCQLHSGAGREEFVRLINNGAWPPNIHDYWALDGGQLMRTSPVSYQLLRLIKWRINGIIKGPNDPREGKIGLKGKMGAITADRF